MCSKQWSAGYADVLSLFKIPTLSDCREYLSLCTMFRIIQETMYFPKDVFVPKLPDNLRSSSNTLFRQPFAKSNAFCILLFPLPVRYGISYLCLLQTHQHYYHLKSHYLNMLLSN